MRYEFSKRGWEIIMENKEIEEKYTSDGINKETGEYNPQRDAWYPNFKALADAEKEVLGRRTY